MFFSQDKQDEYLETHVFKGYKNKIWKDTRRSEKIADLEMKDNSTPEEIAKLYELINSENPPDLQSYLLVLTPYSERKDYLLPVKSGLLKVNKELDSTRCASASEEDMTKVIANANKWDLEYNGDKCKKFNLGMPTDSDGNFCLRGANTVSDKDRETIYLRCK